MFKINYLKYQNKKEKNGLVRVIDRDKLNKVISKFPYELTSDQKKAIEDICNDLESPSRMNRLLQGDVGTGKTIVSFIAMIANYYSGYQSALMAPTEILAQQHYDNLVELLKGLDIKVSLLTGSTSKKDKILIYKGLSEGSINMVVGTHALIQDDVNYNNLGLVITDEQHRFGVNQRANLQNKGVRPDVLYMSATPIPRTYALTIYGDMDVSIIKEKPKGRAPIVTTLKRRDELKDVLQIMYDELKLGHQIYVISPLIEDSEESGDISSVLTLKEQMKLAFKDKYKADIIHGKMTSLAKDNIMNQFRNEEVQILISTTVIEVGVDNPNASVIVIFDADRFGLSTLHQLRGRVGRGSIKSRCILISDSDADRLRVMEKVDDGFVISEEDFKLRGHGDLFGTKQSGDMTFKIASLKEDYKILLQAKKDSESYLKDSSNDNSSLKKKLISQITNA